jgi:aliphatic nitrilase
VIGPSGEPVSDMLRDVEGILYHEIDVNLCVEPKQFHDVVGSYNRFDIFDLRVNRARLKPIAFEERDSGVDVAASEALATTDQRVVRFRT